MVTGVAGTSSVDPCLYCEHPGEPLLVRVWLSTASYGPQQAQARLSPRCR